MKKTVVLLFSILMLASVAHAVNTPINYNDQDQGQIQGQHQGQEQGQSLENDQYLKSDSDSKAYSDSDSKAYSDSDSKAKSIAGSASVQKGNDTNVTNSTEVHTFAPAPTAASTGTDNINASSPLFNAGVSSTKKYIILKEQYNLIQMMAKDGYLSAEDAKAESIAILDQFKAETRRKKVLGFVPYTRNVCDNALVSALPLVCE